MPRIIFKNIDKNTVKELSQELIDSLAAIIDCPSDWITFEHIENTVYFSGKDITLENIYVEISWFKRTQETQNRLASFIHDALKLKLNDGRDITIIFYELIKENYFENGKHY